MFDYKTHVDIQNQLAILLNQGSLTQPPKTKWSMLNAIITTQLQLLQLLVEYPAESPDIETVIEMYKKNYAEQQKLVVDLLNKNIQNSYLPDQNFNENYNSDDRIPHEQTGGMTQSTHSSSSKAPHFLDGPPVDNILESPTHEMRASSTHSNDNQQF